MNNAERVYDFINEAHSFYLATVEGDQPRVRVYGASLFFEDKLYIMAFNHSAATQQVAANPKFEICAFKGKQLRLTGKLVEDGRQEVKDAMLQKSPGLKSAIGEKGENAVMYYIADATAIFADLQGNSETLKF